MNDISLHTWKAQLAYSRLNMKKITPMHIRVKLLTTKGKENILKGDTEDILYTGE